ncbi:hypothetical protein [Allomuricauda sp. SCSIO 65647]|uniref:hypothetical protein n=1 Tax=Allomuricauda sp. SCSIO 65647 TaxID=2908843 RepID=UPI001F37AC5A|nr:hypothetical protein [Muricauda sp. SCSIO 65647]UJH68193.1 hypothetical protein L0P89_03050 [Muricauda sp. SCSIO 65647]
MLEQVHLVAQYLAMAGKSFLKEKEDDSHTNVGFVTETKFLETWPLNENGTKLQLDLLNFSLSWSSNKSALSLDGKSHKEVITWITETAQATGIRKAFNYQLHYTLPYSTTDTFKYQRFNQDHLVELAQLRTLADTVIRSFLKEEGLQSNIRIWPHHFDTGAFAHLKDGSGKSMGLGMAIPDTLVDEHYFYISGYHDHGAIDVSRFAPLRHGEWKNEGFKGAILPVSQADETKALIFFQDALKAYTN